jgi:hypothetical protein
VEADRLGAAAHVAVAWDPELQGCLRPFLPLRLQQPSWSRYLRHEATPTDIQVKLLALERRNRQNLCIAKHLRPELIKLGLPFGARI